MFLKTILSSGVRVVTIPMPEVKSVTALVLVKTGSRYETKEINGISHFLEHLSFKGTKKRSTALSIATILDGLGASYNAFTDKEYTGFYVKTESRHLETSLDLLSDMLQNSLYDAAEMDKERGVIIEEINMYEDQPQELVGEYFEELLYGDSPIGWRVIGTKENITKISRDQIVDYINKQYHGGSIIVVVAGNIIDISIQKYFEKIKSRSENKFIPVGIDQNLPKSMINYKKSDQAHLVLGCHSLPIGHPDRYVQAILATILGGNMSSRLFTEIREKRGLAYYISAGVSEMTDCGYFAVHAGVNLKNTDEAIKIILGEFEKIKAKAAEVSELRRAKDFWRSKMVLGLESSSAVASFYGMQELQEKKLETVEEILTKVDAVTIEDIQRLANSIFVNQNLNLALIGPFQEKEKFDKILRL